MKKIINSITHLFHWVTQSSRLRHIKYGFYAGLCGTILAAIGAGLVAVYKDKQHDDKIDWVDVEATIIGGMFGQAAQLLLVFMMYKIIK